MLYMRPAHTYSLTCSGLKFPDSRPATVAPPGHMSGPTPTQGKKEIVSYRGYGTPTPGQGCGALILNSPPLLHQGKSTEYESTSNNV